MISTAIAPVRPVSRRGRWGPLPLLLAGFGAVMVVQAASWLGAPLPQCWLRKLTGIPCPSCGCTRSLAAWWDMDVTLAFRFNPLFFLLCVAVLIWSMLWLAEKLSRRPFLETLKARRPPWPWWKIGLALLGLNWLYLCLALPK